jgi:hypothetical protein
VLAEAVQKRMLGEITDYDVEHAAPAKRTGNRRLAADSTVSDQVRRLRRDLDATIEELKVTPDHVKRLVDTALELDGETDLLGWQDAVQFGGDMTALALEVPEHETTITPSFTLRDPASGEIRLLGLVSDGSPVVRVAGSD